MLTPPRKERMQDAFLQALRYLETLPTGTPCSECLHWVIGDASCDRWGAVPPADVQQTGCEAWAEGVPF